jgi:hypothetical protein
MTTRAANIGLEEQERVVQNAITLTSATVAPVRQNEGGEGEGRGKRVKKAPKSCGEG